MREAQPVTIESWEGPNELWIAATEYVDAKGHTHVLVERGYSRENAVGLVEDKIADLMKVEDLADRTRQVHQVYILPEGPGMRVQKDSQ